MDGTNLLDAITKFALPFVAFSSMLAGLVFATTWLLDPSKTAFKKTVPVLFGIVIVVVSIIT
jgi:sorbitol-specific phosphotransferase system component IIBC